MKSKTSRSLANVPKFHMRLGPDKDGTALAAYRQNVELLYQLEFEPEAAARFSSQALTYMLPRAVLASVDSVAQTLRRTPEQIARGGDQCVIHLQLKGEVEANYAGRKRTVRPGDVAIIDYTREIESHATDFSIIYLMVQRDAVPRSFLDSFAHGTVFPAESGAARILYRTLETLLHTADRLTLAEADAAVDGILAMVAGLLDAEFSRESDFADQLLTKALALVDREIANPELSPALLETNLPLSRSALYRLFEPLGGVRAAILQRRLERGMKTLLTGQSAKPPLRAIARNHGFRSEDQFSRSFRKLFGSTPNQFYDMVRRKDHAALLAQAERTGFANLHAWIEAFPDKQ